MNVNTTGLLYKVWIATMEFTLQPHCHTFESKHISVYPVVRYLKDNMASASASARLGPMTLATECIFSAQTPFFLNPFCSATTQFPLSRYCASFIYSIIYKNLQTNAPITLGYSGVMWLRDRLSHGRSAYVWEPLRVMEILIPCLEYLQFHLLYSFFLVLGPFYSSHSSTAQKNIQVIFWFIHIHLPLMFFLTEISCENCSWKLDGTFIFTTTSYTLHWNCLYSLRARFISFFLALLWLVAL